jgi:hypothetical protein
VNNEPTYSIDEFERESRYIENLIWDALVIEENERVLFCGFGPDGSWVKRAIQKGADVTVIEHRDEVIREFEGLGAELLRGSTSVIPAKDGTYDLAISFHYLHEVDPFFHAQVVSELARVGKRVAIVEPAPPADPLGRRIALLYSQAKRELGQFEYYQPMDYWKKLLQAVKAEITQSVFAFGKVPPREYLHDTIELLLDTMEVEEAPRAYLEELRTIARRPGAQLLPPARFVLVGAAAGELPQPRFTPREAPKRAEPAPAIAAAPAAPVQREYAPPVQPEYPPVVPPPQQAPAAAQPVPPSQPVPQAPPAAQPPQPTPGFGPPPAAEMPFGAPPVPGWGAPPPPAPGNQNEPAPFGMPFAIPPPQLPEQEGMPFGLPPAAERPTGWQWEPPEEEEPKP